jgi:hypothetical protein
VIRFLQVYLKHITDETGLPLIKYHIHEAERRGAEDLICGKRSTETN